MARAAQGIESCARALKEARLAWSEAVRGELIRGVDDVKILMRRLRQPEQGDVEEEPGAPSVRRAVTDNEICRPMRWRILAKHWPETQR